MQFIQKCPQFSPKMSASNACMLATFFMSGSILVKSQTRLILIVSKPNEFIIWLMKILPSSATAPAPARLRWLYFHFLQPTTHPAGHPGKVYFEIPACCPAQRKPHLSQIGLGFISVIPNHPPTPTGKVYFPTSAT